MNWDYADLSKAAKAAGGPGQYIAAVEAASKRVGILQGRQEMVPVTAIMSLAAVGITTFFTVGIPKLLSWKMKKEEKRLNQAKEAFIEEMER